MTQPSDIANRALAKIASRETIVDIEENSSTAGTVRLFYHELRRRLLQSAPWGFARTQIVLTTTGQWDNQTSPYPYLWQYAYPADCLHARYILPTPANTVAGPQVNVGLPLWIGPPSRQYRFLVAGQAQTTPGIYTKSILSNVQNALLVYTMDVTNPDMFDPLFTDAFASALAAELALPITGDRSIRTDQLSLAADSIAKARTADSSEALPTTDHTVDWIAARSGGTWAGSLTEWGAWYSPFAETSWGM